MSFTKSERRGATAPPAGVSARVYELLQMLTYMRPAGSSAEDAFIRQWLGPLGCRADKYGNRILQVGRKPSILWSCHTDTVHKMPGIQRVAYGDGIATSDGDCLGADCTAGIWLMVNMIRAKVPGLYVFHRAEEIGCKGSRWIADNTPHILDGIDAAIAFDRRGHSDIITHQVGMRTASDAFARSLATALAPLKYRADDGGIFTDTDSYAGIVPECTNISVGYEGAHSKRESQDVDHLVRLLDVIVEADWTGLTIARDPSVEEFSDWHRDPAWKQDGKPFSVGASATPMEDYVRRYPHVVADFLDAMGFSEGDINDWDVDRWADAVNDDDPLGDNRRH